jgi:hypothetical protein
MLKPNTRFLRHIIKGTDSHNKALLAKEASESQARLKDFERSEEAKRLKTNPTQQDVRRRQMGDIHAILGGKKRRRTDESDAPSSGRDLIMESKSRENPGSRNSRKDRGQDEGQDKSKDLTRDRHHERAHRRRLSYDERPGRTDEKSDRDRRSTSDKKRRRSRSRNSRSGEEERRHRHRSRRERPRSTEHRRRSRSRSPRRHKSRHRERSPIEDREARSKQDEQKRQDDDSDSLDDLIGPAPAPTHRGRGRVGGYSGIDRRFSETYDPKTDIQMDDDEAIGNADDAFELFRDRQKLKQAQQQRMREAGFSEDHVKRVNATDTTLEDNVRWTKAGEKRAWDQGKAVDSEGSVSVDDVV